MSKKSSHIFQRGVALLAGVMMLAGMTPAFPLQTKADYEIPGLEFYDGGRLASRGDEALDSHGSEGVTVTREELLAPLCALPQLAGVSFASATVTLTGPTGSVQDANPNATLLPDDSVLFRTDRVGTEEFYYVVTLNGVSYQPVPVRVHTYGVCDSTFVLDYSLPVELFAQEGGILSDDVISLPQNPDTICTLVADGSLSGHYGEFSATESSLVYTMSRIMDGVETVEVSVTILEAGATELNKSTGVTLTQRVTLAPANVMYYEDDFSGLTYINTGSDATGNIWAIYRGENVHDRQSIDQTMSYGSDPAYRSGQTSIYSDLYLDSLDGADESLRSAVGDRIYETMYGQFDPELEFLVHALYGDASNDTIHAMSIGEAVSAPLMTFDFTGTGFEIISRTTSPAYAVLTVLVEDLNALDETGRSTKTRAIPVITECVNSDLTQVPIVARQDMEYSRYRVTVYGSNRSGASRMFYVDGVRVYQPLTAEDQKTYYKPDENAATITEIRTGIFNGEIVYGQMKTTQRAGDSIAWVYGYTMIEDDREGGFTLRPTTGPEEYGIYGPNNEIYLGLSPEDIIMATEDMLSYVAFYVELDESFTGGERSIQVGAHVKNTIDAYTGDPNVDDAPVELVYGVSGSTFDSGVYVHRIASGTEQYVTLNADLVFINANGRSKALVIIGSRDMSGKTLSLTNLKLNGYKLSSGTVVELLDVQDAYDINVSTLMSETHSLYAAMLERR